MFFFIIFKLRESAFRDAPKVIYKEDDEDSLDNKEIEYLEENKEKENKYNLADIPMDFLSRVYEGDVVLPLENDKIETPGKCSVCFTNLSSFFLKHFFLMLFFFHLQKILMI